MTFKLGDSQLIQGWNEGIAGMKVGEQRKLTIPPSLAYGALGRLPAIPPNGILTVDVELLAIGEPPADLNAQSLGKKFTIPSKADMDGGVTNGSTLRRRRRKKRRMVNIHEAVGRGSGGSQK